MKKIFLILILSISFIFNLAQADNTYKIVELNRGSIFKYFSQTILKNTPKSFKYINLNFSDIKNDNPNYQDIQRLVWWDLIENKKIKLNLNSKLSAYVFYSLLEKQTGYDFVNQSNYKNLKLKNTTNLDLIFVNWILNSLKQKDNKSLLKVFWDSKKIEIFQDVYNTILSDHYDSLKINKDDLIYSSIAWLAKWSGDKFTTYFPPIESKNFEESLAWEFEWIWAYVDMENPWELKIISPIAWSPSEKVWIKWGDIIKKINWIEVTKTMTLKQAVNMIKWPAWTKVILDILRWEEKLSFEVTREKIIINDVEYKVLNDNFFYIQIRMFWDKVFNQTSQAIDELKKHDKIKKIIIDLRNNPGWYLDSAVNILSLFIPKSSPVVIVKYKNWDLTYNSYWYNKINLGEYEVYILANSWTASASEILIWSLKDYFPNIKIIWENTYWKWSVQTIKYYDDGSSLKYTIAKWYTWKTTTWIDGIWITPDVKLGLDLEKFKSWVDNQLDYILNWLK